MLTRRGLTVALTCAAAAACLLGAGAPLAPAQAGTCRNDVGLVEQSESVQDLAAGARLSVYRADRSPEPSAKGRPVQLTVVQADLARVAAGVWSAPLGRTKPVQALAGTRGLIAAVNGDYFDLSDYGLLPRGPVMAHGELLYTTPGTHDVLVIDKTGRPHATTVSITGTATFTWTGRYKGKPVTRTRAVTVSRVNSELYPGRSSAVLFTRSFTSADRPHGVRELAVSHGKVVANLSVRRRVPIKAKPGVHVLTVGSTVARSLAAVPKKARASLAWKITTGDGSRPAAMLGRGGREVSDGRLLGACNGQVRPRTSIGWNDDGRIWIATTTQGYETTAVRWGGSSTRQMGAWLRELGATEVVALDGGGSTTLMASANGRFTRFDLPASTWQRPVPNGFWLRTR